MIPSERLPDRFGAACINYCEDQNQRPQRVSGRRFSGEYLIDGTAAPDSASYGPDQQFSALPPGKKKYGPKTSPDRNVR